MVGGGLNDGDGFYGMVSSPGGLWLRRQRRQLCLPSHGPNRRAPSQPPAITPVAVFGYSSADADYLALGADNDLAQHRLEQQPAGDRAADLRRPGGRRAEYEARIGLDLAHQTSPQPARAMAAGPERIRKCSASAPPEARMIAARSAMRVAACAVAVGLSACGGGGSSSGTPALPGSSSTPAAQASTGPTAKASFTIDAPSSATPSSTARSTAARAPKVRVVRNAVRVDRAARAVVAVGRRQHLADIAGLHVERRRDHVHGFGRSTDRTRHLRRHRLRQHERDRQRRRRLRSKPRSR